MATPKSDKYLDLLVFFRRFEAGNGSDKMFDLVLNVRIPDTVLSCIQTSGHHRKTTADITRCNLLQCSFQKLVYLV